MTFIDTQLFQNRTSSNCKFTGEEFKLILKKVFPYIEVIVITQNEIPEEYTSTIPKYNPKKETSADDYYNKLLKPKIDEAITRICEYRAIVSDMEEDSENSFIWNRYL